MTADQIRQGRPRAAIMHVNQVDPSHCLEQLTVKMGRTARPGRRHIDSAWIGFGIGDELGNGPRRNCWIDFHDTRGPDHAGDRFDIADEIERKLLVKGGVERVCHCCC